MPKLILRQNVLLRLKMKIPKLAIAFNNENQLSLLIRWMLHVHRVRVYELAEELGVSNTTLKNGRRTTFTPSTNTLLLLHDWIWKYFRVKVELDTLKELAAADVDDKPGAYFRVTGEIRRQALGE